MAPGDEKPQSPEVQQFRINRMERDLSELVKTVKSLADLVQAQEVRREAEREQRGRERKDDQEHRAESALSLQQWGLILTVATIAFTLAGGVVAPFLQKMILGG